MNPAPSAAAGLPDPERLRALLARYDRPGPRYTSYPTAPVWTDAFGEAELCAALARSAGDKIAVYVHVPFCESLCTYCACNREIHRDHSVVGPYLDDLEREADALAAALGPDRACAQLAVGGGTPTYLDERQLARLCGIVDSHFPLSPGAERSVEVDPRVTTRGQLEVLATHGFNRISLGVQDFSPAVQKAIRRIQSVEETWRLARDSRALGFKSVNYDLIYGLPFQTVASFSATVDRVIEQRPNRVALYSYAHVPWVSKQQRGFERSDLPDAERKIAIFTSALARLVGAGYRYLGLDHFALPADELSRAVDRGDLRRNFMGYTTRRRLELVALGPSGISEVGDAYAQSARGVAEWSARIRGGGLATWRGWRLDEDDRRRRWLIHHLMCQGTIDPVAYESAFDTALEETIPDLAERLAPFGDDGLLVAEGSGWALTPEGRVLVRPVAMAFDAYLPADDGTPPRFSRSV